MAEGVIGTGEVRAVAAPWSLRHSAVGLLAAVLLALPTVAAHAATTCAEGCRRDAGTPTAAAEENGPGEDGAAAEQPAATAALAVEVAPVFDGPGDGDGDLVRDPETGLPTLTFTPDGPAELRAVHAYTVTNAGDVALTDIEVVDSRVGVVLAAEDGATLPPGESLTVRGTALLRRADALAGAAGLLVAEVDATAMAGDEPVAASADAPIQVVAVLAAAAVTAQIDVLVNVGDVALGPGDVPTISWSVDEAAVDAPREVHHRVTVSNSGDVPLALDAVTVDLLGVSTPIATEAAELAPGEELTTDLVTVIRPDDVAGVGTSGPLEADVVATLTVEASRADAEGPVLATADSVLHAVLVRAVVDDDVLPAAGVEDAPVLAVTSLALLLCGAGLLRRRPVA